MNEHSKSLLDIAKKCINLIPQNSGSISISGSVSCGRANKYSDIEVDIVNDHIPTKNEIINLIKGVGGEEIRVREEYEDDGALVSEFNWKSKEFEFIWTTFDNIQNVIEPIFNLETTDHEKFVYAWTIHYSILIRDNSGKLLKIKKLVDKYPNGLDIHLIRKNLENKMTSKYGIQSAIRRKESFILAKRRIDLLITMFRLIFAVNCLWEPYWKWVMTELYKISHKPEDFDVRINTLLGEDILGKQTWIDLLSLYRQTLDLIQFPVLEKIVEKKKELISGIIDELV